MLMECWPDNPACVNLGNILQAVAPLFEERIYEDGVFLAKQGEAAKCIFYIQEGSAIVYHTKSASEDSDSEEEEEDQDVSAHFSIPLSCLISPETWNQNVLTGIRHEAINSVFDLAANLNLSSLHGLCVVTSNWYFQQGWLRLTMAEIYMKPLSQSWSQNWMGWIEAQGCIVLWQSPTSSGKQRRWCMACLSPVQVFHQSDCFLPTLIGSTQVASILLFQISNSCYVQERSREVTDKRLRLKRQGSMLKTMYCATITASRLVSAVRYSAWFHYIWSLGHGCHAWFFCWEPDWNWYFDKIYVQCWQPKPS